MGISSALGSSALLPAGLGFRNLIINGGFDVWQRGTSGFATSDGTYTADRWRHTSNNLTITRDADVPSGFRYSAKLVGTSDNSFSQRIEAATASKLAGKQVYFSCWAKRTSGSGAVDVRFYYPSAEDNFASNTQIGSTVVLSSSPSSSWSYYTATITLPADVSKGLMVLINNVGASTTFITGVQLEQNYQPTPFEQRPIGVELALCQRYYYKHVDGAVVTVGTICNAANFSATDARGIIHFPVTMRGIPTLSASSGTNYYAFARNSADDSFNSLTIVSATTTCSGVGNSTEISGTAGHAGYFRTDNASATVAFQAEL